MWLIPREYYTFGHNFTSWYILSSLNLYSSYSSCGSILPVRFCRNTIYTSFPVSWCLCPRINLHYFRYLPLNRSVLQAHYLKSKPFWRVVKPYVTILISFICVFINVFFYHSLYFSEIIMFITDMSVIFSYMYDNW